MAKLRKRGEELRQYILEHAETNPKDFISLTIQKYNITRQAVHKHIRILIEQGALTRIKNGQYELRPQEEWEQQYPLVTNHQRTLYGERNSATIGQLPDNALNIWHYGFTEMFNNVIDHSESGCVLKLKRNAYSTEMSMLNLGVGIFNKIKNAMNLLDERHAVLELTKGKLTTDPTPQRRGHLFYFSHV